jgi:methylphosphotriester-DNA--protein-cysteine methyltransferase
MPSGSGVLPLIRAIPRDCPAASPALSRLVVGQALGYFALHFRRPIAMAAVADALGISEACLDFCFDQSRGMTPYEALQHHRLNRLFAAITRQPRRSLTRAILACGLKRSADTLTRFEATFGIAMPLFLLTCRRAEQDRHFRRGHPQRAALVLAQASSA